MKLKWSSLSCWQRKGTTPLVLFVTPFRQFATLVATSPFRGDITVCVVLTIAVIANFYMLPERELASPKAMTEGCATKLFISD